MSLTSFTYNKKAGNGRRTRTRRAGAAFLGGVFFALLRGAVPFLPDELAFLGRLAAVRFAGIFSVVPPNFLDVPGCMKTHRHDYEVPWMRFTVAGDYTGSCLPCWFVSRDTQACPVPKARPT